MKKCFGGRAFQLGFIVEDLDAAMDYWQNTLELLGFICMRDFVAVAGKYREETANPRLTLAHAYAGDMYIELIQQHDQVPSVYTEHQAKHGYGLHHLGVAVDPAEYDQVLSSYLDKGYEIAFADQLPSGARVRYLAPIREEGKDALFAAVGVSFLEMVELVPEEAAFFDSMRSMKKD